jgi:hypothetical protein
MDEPSMLPKGEPTDAVDWNLWFATKSMYDRASFEQVARREPQCPVLRLARVK